MAERFSFSLLRDSGGLASLAHMPLHTSFVVLLTLLSFLSNITFSLAVRWASRRAGDYGEASLGHRSYDIGALAC